MKLFRKVYNTRLGKYLIYGSFYILMWKLAGFEFTMIVMGCTILGELDYLFIDDSE
jgi:hypothetical protein